jgi:uncharacterized RDD family membrane protein YckC
MNYNTTLTKRATQIFGKRIIAALLDLALWTVLGFVVALNFGTTNTIVQGDMVTKQMYLTGVPLFIFLGVSLLYFVLMEWLLGSSLGKLLMKVQVVNAQGKRIAFSQSLVRNVFRIIDAFPYFIPYLTGLIVGANNKTHQRWGDQVAETFVVDR